MNVDVQTLINRHDSGESFAKIGARYGLTKWQVRHAIRAVQAGRTLAHRRRYSDEQNAEIVRLGNAGLTNREIAAVVGCSADYAAKCCRRAWRAVRDWHV